jgi:hypothetical protein
MRQARAAARRSLLEDAPDELRGARLPRAAAFIVGRAVSSHPAMGHAMQILLAIGIALQLLVQLGDVINTNLASASGNGREANWFVRLCMARFGSYWWVEKALFIPALVLFWWVGAPWGLHSAWAQVIWLLDAFGAIVVYDNWRVSTGKPGLF